MTDAFSTITAAYTAQENGADTGRNGAQHKDNGLAPLPLLKARAHLYTT